MLNITILHLKGVRQAGDNGVGIQMQALFYKV